MLFSFVRRPLKKPLFRAALCAATFAPLVLSGKTPDARAARPPQKTAADVIWLPEEISRMTPAMLMKSGIVLPLFVVPNNVSGVQPGGVWEAEAGTISKNGVYTAPRFMPIMGTDTIKYTDSNGKYESLEVRIVPNPAIPGSEKTLYLECPPEILRGSKAGDPPDPNDGPMTPETKRFYDALRTAPPNIAIVAMGTKPVPQAISKPIVIPVETVNGARFCQMPISGHRIGKSPLAVRLSAGQKPLSYARLLPAMDAAILANRLWGQAEDARKAKQAKHKKHK